MPKQKDLKRLTRSRMEKTGESYTTARAQLLQKKADGLSGPEPDYAALAGMSDEAVRAKTGRTWKEWTGVLDAIEAASLPHREIAMHVHEEHGIPGWWAQTVTVGYERIRGLREVGQRRGGSYDVNKSKTVAVPVESLFEAFHDAEVRERWLPGVEPTVRKATQYKSIRWTWPDCTPVEAYFTAKGEAKSQVSVQHRKLGSKADADEAKEHWGARLQALAEILRTTSGAG